MSPQALHTIDRRVTIIEENYVSKPEQDEWLTVIHNRFNGIENRLDRHDAKFLLIDQRFDALEAKIDASEEKNERRYEAIMTILDNMQYQIKKIQEDHIAMIEWIKRHDVQLEKQGATVEWLHSIHTLAPIV